MKTDANTDTNTNTGRAGAHRIPPIRCLCTKYYTHHTYHTLVLYNTLSLATALNVFRICYRALNSNAQFKCISSPRQDIQSFSQRATHICSEDFIQATFRSGCKLHLSSTLVLHTKQACKTSAKLLA